MTAKKKRINVKKILNKAFVLSVIVCLCISQTAIFAKADVVEFTEAAKLGATMVDLYGMANNTNIAYNNLTESGALAEVINLYDSYYSSASDPVTLATIGAALAAAGAIAVIYDAVTGQGYVQFYQEQYIESMDGYWDYTCNDMGLFRDANGNFVWQEDENGEIQAISLYSETDTKIDGYQCYTLPITDTNPQNPQYQYIISDVSGGNKYVIVMKQENNDTVIVNVLSPVEGVVNYNWLNANSGSSIVKYDSPLSESHGWYFWSASYAGSIEGQITYTNSNDNIWNYINNYDSAVIVSSDKGINVSPTMVDSALVTIPDITSEDYIPEPISITTNIPWNPEWGNPLPDGVTNPEYGVAYPVTDPATLNNAVPDIWSEVVANNVAESEVAEPDNAPEIGTTTIPLLPITLPSFNFSFSSIWHYVVDWVASLGAWFTTMFTMWNALPYSMVLPVYATAVVVIVIGVYKRFFM